MCIRDCPWGLVSLLIVLNFLWRTFYVGEISKLSHLPLLKRYLLGVSSARNEVWFAITLWINLLRQWLKVVSLQATFLGALINLFILLLVGLRLENWYIVLFGYPYILKDKGDFYLLWPFLLFGTIHDPFTIILHV